MPTITEILDAIAPQIPADSRRDLFIELSEQELDRTLWGKAYNQAVANLTAHKLTLNPAGGSSGLAQTGIKSKKAGDEQIVYQDQRSESPNSLFSTTYGLEFMRLQKRMISSFDWSGRNNI